MLRVQGAAAAADDNGVVRPDGMHIARIQQVTFTV